MWNSTTLSLVRLEICREVSEQIRVWCLIGKRSQLTKQLFAALHWRLSSVKTRSAAAIDCFGVNLEIKYCRVSVLQERTQGVVNLTYQKRCWIQGRRPFFSEEGVTQKIFCIQRLLISAIWERKIWWRSLNKYYSK